MLQGIKTVVVPAPQRRGDPLFVIEDARLIRHRVETPALSIVVWKDLSSEGGFSIDPWLDSLGDQEAKRVFHQSRVMISEDFAPKDALERAVKSFIGKMRPSLSTVDQTLFDKIAQETVFFALDFLGSASFPVVGSIPETSEEVSIGDPRARDIKWDGLFDIDLAHTFAGPQSFFVGTYVGELDQCSRRVRETIEALRFIKQIGLFNHPFVNSSPFGRIPKED